MLRKLSTLLLYIFALSAPACSQNDPRTELVSPAVFMKKLETEKGVLLDVRTPAEYKKGHLKGARLLNIFDDNFEAEISKLDTNATYFVYCGSGGRSAESAELMMKKGFRKVYDLDGGIARWKQAGLPVE